MVLRTIAAIKSDWLVIAVSRPSAASAWLTRSGGRRFSLRCAEASDGGADALKSGAKDIALSNSFSIAQIPVLMSCVGGW
jgi:hypothetical protein